MTDQTAQHPAAPETNASALTDREAHALADAARSTGLSVSGLQLDAIEAEVERILRERLRVVEGERDRWRQYAEERWAKLTVENREKHAATARAESAEADRDALRAGIEALADEWAATPVDEDPWAFEKANTLRALLPGDGR